MATRKNSSSTKKGTRNSPLDFLKANNSTSSSRQMNIGGTGDVARLSVGSRTIAKSVQFGTPAYKGSSVLSNSKRPAGWTDLFGNISGRGLSDLIAGGGIFSAGMDYLTDGIANLFGDSNSTPEPLTRFALPDSQDQTIYIDNSSIRENAALPVAAYNNPQLSPSSHPSKAEIIKTVKNALLTSSSLNDVIGEL